MTASAKLRHFLTQLKALVIKNYLHKKRNYWLTLSEFLVPLYSQISYWLFRYIYQGDLPAFQLYITHYIVVPLGLVFLCRFVLLTVANDRASGFIYLTRDSSSLAYVLSLLIVQLPAVLMTTFFMPNYTYQFVGLWHIPKPKYNCGDGSW